MTENNEERPLVTFALFAYDQERFIREAMELVAETHRLTGAFPKEEVYALRGQMRRAAVSIPSNIATRTQSEAPHASRS